MKVMRKMEIKGVEMPIIGDQIKIKMPDRKYTSTAIKDEGDGMLFLFDEYLDEARPMNEDGKTEGGYDGSDLRAYLQGLEKELPKKLRARMMPFDNGDLLRLLTLQEMFGLNDDFNECEGQIEWLKERRHRVAYRKNKTEYGWLQNVAYSAGFAIVHSAGYASTNHASSVSGVRPAFKIKYL